MESDGKIYLGTDLKFLIDIQCDGFSMADDRFEVKLSRGSKVLEFQKEDLELDSEGHFYVCFSTTDLGSGRIKAEVTAHVPDDDFEDGFREEIQRFELVTVKS